MKIRMGFVSNSSSSSFLVVFKKPLDKEQQDLIYKLCCDCDAKGTIDDDDTLYSEDNTFSFSKNGRFLWGTKSMHVEIYKFLIDNICGKNGIETYEEDN